MVLTKTKITLIGSHLAKIGLEFIYEGELGQCEACKVRKACNNLQPKKRYKITAIRSISQHECLIHKGRACAVEVIESPLIALISADMAIANSTIQSVLSCNKTECKSYELCHPNGIIEGEKYIIGEILGNAPDVCDKGRTLKLVELRPP